MDVRERLSAGAAVAPRKRLVDVGLLRHVAQDIAELGLGFAVPATVIKQAGKEKAGHEIPGIDTRRPGEKLIGLL